MNTGEQVNAPMGNVETHQLATFADDSTLVSGAKPAISENSSWRSFAEENRTHGIIDILSRPVLLTNSSSFWSTSKAVNQFPTDATVNSVFSFPNAILNASPNIVRKLANFTYFKADVKIRIMVNAQAFSQGKLWIWFSPYELVSGTQTSADNLAAKTGYPGVELDVASGVPAEFSIPYCAPNSHYSLTSGEGTMGDLFLTVLSPLTISDASLSVFAWFENIDLTLPTGVDRGILPDEYFVIDQQSVIDRAGNEYTSPVWDNLILLGDGSNKVTLTASLLLVTTTGNFILLPIGTSISASTGPNEELIVVTQSAPTGLSGSIVVNVSGTDYETSLPDASGAFTFGWKPNNAYYTDAPVYIYATSNNTITATNIDIINTYTSQLNTSSLTANYLPSFNTSDKAIYIFPPYTSTKFISGNAVSINNGTTIGSLRQFSGISGGLYKYTTPALATGTAKAFVIAQSGEEEEDDWYKNFPKAQSSEAEMQAMTGVVSNAYKTMKSMSKLPMLSGLTSPLSWIGRLGSLASSGFSKPTDVQILQPNYLLPAKGFTHVTGQDNSVILGSIPDNSIGVSPGVFSTGIDEMDINYICKKSCYLRSDDWSTTTTGKIYSIFVSPGICKVTNNLFRPTLLAFVTSMFRFWHGTLRYRISVAKTGFHTGRLRISYHPGALTTSTYYHPDNAYSWILDLSVSSEIDIEIPYVAPKPWLSCDLFSDTNSNPFGPAVSTHSLIGSNNLQFSSGVLQIEVLNQLRVAGAASQTVDILTWVSSGDIEFAVPIMSSFVPARSYNPPTLAIPSLARSKRDVLMPIISEDELHEILNNTPSDEQQEEDDIPEAQAFQNITPATDHMSQLNGADFNNLFSSSSAFASSKTLCIGESVSNLRELTRRFTPYAIKLGTTNSITPFGMIFDPSWFGTLVNEARPELIKITTQQGTVVGAYTNCVAPIEYISKIFRFFRGSRRYKAVLGNANSGDSSIQNFMVQGYLSPTVFVNGDVTAPQIYISTTGPEDTFDIKSVFSHFCDGVTNKVCEVSAPFYSDTPIQVISDGTVFTNGDNYAMRHKVIFNPGPTANNNAKQVLYYTAAGDDFSFGYLIGAPSLKRISQPFEFSDPT